MRKTAKSQDVNPGYRPDSRSSLTSPDNAAPRAPRHSPPPPTASVRAGRSTVLAMSCPTVGFYLGLYLRDVERLVALHDRKPKTLQHWRSIARYLEALRDRPLADLSVAEIREWHFNSAQAAAESGASKATTGGVSANQALTLLSMVLRRAEEDGAIPRGSSPARLVKRFRVAPRLRYLTEAETAALWRALAQVERATVRHARRPKNLAHSPFQALRLILLLGLRKMEALALRWDQVDLESGLLRLDDAKTGLRETALSEEACTVLREQARRRINEWVFPSRYLGTHVQFVYDVWDRVKDVAMIEDPEAVVIHTARHALATCALRRGEAIEHVSLLLGHTSTKVTRAVYGRPLATPGMRALVQRQADIVTGRVAA